IARNRKASNRSRSYVDALTSSPPAEDAAWTEAPGCRRLQLTSESAGKEYSRAPATEWFPPKTSITESAPIPAKAKPVEAFPSASIRKSTPSYPVASPNVPPFIEAKRYRESWSRRLAYRAIETFASEATVAASNIGTDDRPNPAPTATPLTRPVPVTKPLTRPFDVTSPLTRPAGAERPFTRPIPFTRPLVLPTPFTSPLTRPFPLTTPLTRPVPRGACFGRTPLTSPRLPRTHCERNPSESAIGVGGGGVGFSPSSVSFAASCSIGAGAIRVSGAIDSSSSSMSQSRTAALVRSSSSDERDSSSSPTKRSSTRASSSGVGEASGRFGGGAGAGGDNRRPHEGHKAISAGTAAPHCGHSRSAWVITRSSWATSSSQATSSRRELAVERNFVAAPGLWNSFA